MSKIKLLYDVTKAMKNLEQIDGVLQLRVRKDQEEVFTLRNKFERNKAGKTRTTVSTALNLDGGQVTRESTTEFDLSGSCHSGMLGKMLHRRRGAHGDVPVAAVCGVVDGRRDAERAPRQSCARSTCR